MTAFKLERDRDWEWIRPDNHIGLKSEGKIMTFVRKGLLSDEEASEFMVYAANHIHRNECPAFGKRSYGQSVDDIPGTGYNRVFMFYAKDKFDAIYVNNALINAMLNHPKLRKEITRLDSPKGGRGATTKTRWKADIVSMFPESGYKSSNEFTKTEIDRVVRDVLSKNVEMDDKQLAALLVHNDCCPTQVTNVVLNAFFGDYGEDVADRFRRQSGEIEFFNHTQYVSYETVLSEIKQLKLILPAGVKDPYIGN